MRAFYNYYWCWAICISLQLLRLIYRLPPLLPNEPPAPARPADLCCRNAAAAAKSAPTRALQPFVIAAPEFVFTTEIASPSLSDKLASPSTSEILAPAPWMEAQNRLPSRILHHASRPLPARKPPPAHSPPPHPLSGACATCWDLYCLGSIPKSLENQSVTGTGSIILMTSSSDLLRGIEEYTPYLCCCCYLHTVALQRSSRHRDPSRCRLSRFQTLRRLGDGGI
jgi:hypothetical protein